MDIDFFNLKRLKCLFYKFKLHKFWNEIVIEKRILEIIFLN